MEKNDVHVGKQNDTPRSGELTDMHEPTDAGRILWSFTDGWLDVIPETHGAPSRLPCTCSKGCLSKDCKGKCGCEACVLAWMVREDERALWDDSGRLVAPEELEGPWQRIRNADQLALRFQYHNAEKPNG